MLLFIEIPLKVRDDMVGKQIVRTADASCRCVDVATAPKCRPLLSVARCAPPSPAQVVADNSAPAEASNPQIRMLRRRGDLANKPAGNFPIRSSCLQIAYSQSIAQTQKGLRLHVTP